MTRRLIVDSKFVPCCADDGDEIFRNGYFHFNITKLIEHLQSESSQVQVGEIPVSEFSGSFSVIDESHLENVNLTLPVIVAEIAPRRFNLIDGNHRMEKARRSAIETLPGYRLDITQHLNFLTTKNAYDAYVAYWNEKLN